MSFQDVLLKILSIILTWLLALTGTACAQLTDEQVKTLGERTAGVVKVAEDLGLQADGYLKLGPAKFGNIFVADLGLDGEFRFRANPGSVNCDDLLEVLKLVIQKIPPGDKPHIPVVGERMSPGGPG